jgi:hypothetical protein
MDSQTETQVVVDDGSNIVECVLKCGNTLSAPIVMTDVDESDAKEGRCPDVRVVGRERRAWI